MKPKKKRSELSSSAEPELDLGAVGGEIVGRIARGQRRSPRLAAGLVEVATTLVVGEGAGHPLPCDLEERAVVERPDAHLAVDYLAAGIALSTQQGGDLREASHLVRRFIADAADHGNLQTAMAMMTAAAGLIARHDPSTARLLVAVFERRWAQTSSLLLPNDPSARDDLDDTFERLTPREIIGIALNALDNLE